MDTKQAIATPNLTDINAQPLEENPAAVYLAGLSESGRITQQQALSVIAGLLGYSDFLSVPWADMRFQHVAAVRARLSEQYKPATVNKMLSAFRGVLKAAWKLGQMSGDAYQLARSVENIENDTLPAGRGLDPGELLALIRICEADNSPAGARDAAIISVMYAGGLRREEVVSASKYNPEDGQLIVSGKRNKERTVYLTNGAKEALEDWLELRGDWEGALFCPVSRWGKIVRRSMTDQAVFNMLEKRAEQAGVKAFSPHDLRRSFISDLLDAGADIATVAKMAGHKSVNTTARYDRRPERAKQKAAGLLLVPYKGKGK